MPLLLTRQDPFWELVQWNGLVGLAQAKAEKILGEILKVLFNLTLFVFFFSLPLCTYHCLTHISHPTCPFCALIPLCSPVFVEMYTTKQALFLGSLCSLATAFISFIFCFCFFNISVVINEKWKKNTNNNSHALRQKENPKTKHFHHWCINMRKEASLYLRICCCF